MNGGVFQKSAALLYPIFYNVTPLHKTYVILWPQSREKSYPI